MPNSATVRNAMTYVVQRRQQREIILNRSNEMHQLDRDDCNEDVDSLSPLINLFVSDNSIRVFKAFNPLSRDAFEAVWGKIGVHVITNWSTSRGPRCKTTPKDAFIVLSMCHLPTK